MLEMSGVNSVIPNASILTISQGDQLCNKAQQSFHQSRERSKARRLARQSNSKTA
jgi:hypothetical protein